MYKAGQGMPSRIGAMVVGALIAFYASYSWFRWHPFGVFGASESVLTPDFAISLVLLIGIVVFFGWLVFKSPRSSEYLIDMDDELRKVVWPGVMPLFDPRTEAWGSTYVVIVCAIIFTVFIWVADMLLHLIIQRGLIESLLFA